MSRVLIGLCMKRGEGSRWLDYVLMRSVTLGTFESLFLGRVEVWFPYWTIKYEYADQVDVCLVV